MKLLQRRFLVASALLILAARPASAADVYELLPGDTQAVLTCNVKMVLACDLIKKEIPKIRENIRELPEASFAMSTLGFDPLKDVERVILATSNVDDEDEVFVIVKGKFDINKIKTLAKAASVERKDHFKIHSFDGQALFEAWLPEEERPTYFSFADAQTLVASVKKNYVTDALQVSNGKKKSALSKDLRAVLKKENPKQCITLSALGKGLTGTTTSPDKVEQFFGGITITDAVHFHFTVVTQDAPSAIRVANDLKEAMKAASQLMSAFADDPAETTLVKQVLDGVKISAHSNTIIMTATVSAEVIQKLIARGSSDS